MTNLSQRVHEAKRLGFRRCLVAAPRGGLSRTEGIELIPVKHVREAVALALE